MNPYDKKSSTRFRTTSSCETNSLEHSSDSDRVGGIEDTQYEDLVAKSRRLLKETFKSNDCAMTKLLKELCAQSPGMMSERNCTELMGHSTLKSDDEAFLGSLSFDNIIKRNA